MELRNHPLICDDDKYRLNGFDGLKSVFVLLSDLS